MSTTFRWALVGLAAFAAMLYATTDLTYFGYVISWGGAQWKCMSGGATGYAFARWICGIDLSSIPDDRRPIAGVSVALIVAAGMIGVPLGS